MAIILNLLTSIYSKDGETLIIYDFISYYMSYFFLLFLPYSRFYYKPLNYFL